MTRGKKVRSDSCTPQNLRKQNIQGDYILLDIQKGTRTVFARSTFSMYSVNEVCFSKHECLVLNVDHKTLVVLSM